MLKIHQHYDPTYRYTVNFLYGNYSSVKTYMQRFGYEQSDNPPNGRAYFCANSLTAWIWLRHKRDYGALAHECLHAVLDILDLVGAKYDADHSEHLCYFVQALVDSYIDGIKEAEAVEDDE